MSHKTFTIIKKPIDTLNGQKVMRVSIGGSVKTGFYIVYRGKLTDIKELVGDAFKALHKLPSEPKESPETENKT